MTHKTEVRSNYAIAENAYRMLIINVENRWFNAAPRVRRWRDTIISAYEAMYDGEGDKNIEFPADATTREGLSYDKAINILEAFDNWLGRDIIWDVRDWAEEEAE